jgi:hypothetical protein
MRRPRCSPHLLCLLLISCSDYKLAYEENNTPGGDDTAAGSDDTDTPPVPEECESASWPAEAVGLSDQCPVEPKGGFTPIVEWESGAGYNCTALPVVADLDGDGLPEIIYNRTDFLAVFGGTGTLVALRGDGSGTLWQVEAGLGYGDAPAVADINDDGSPEIFIVREYENPLDIFSGQLFGDGDYTVAMYDASGTEQWESEHFIAADFDYAATVAVSDMDHDGTPEVIVGRVILSSTDGSTRGVGEYGRGSWGYDPLGFLTDTGLEASVSAVTDIDLDGQEEVIVGDAIYAIDGTAKWVDTSGTANDGMIAVANLDDDPEGEWVASTNNTVRAHDTDGSLLWGPVTITSGNILSVAGIADLDNDGYPEIVVAGGNELRCINHDGSTLWSTQAHDESGATGASIFDFEGDGELEVVYIDEMEMIAFEGATGVRKFYSNQHSSATMMDYPVIADVDADDHAEIVVCHDGYSSAISVYGDLDDSWASARTVWNQHAYSISNINDDLSVPTTATPGFTTHNTWHSGIAGTGEAVLDDLEIEIAEVCTDECGQGVVYVTVRLRNRGAESIGAGLSVALYARIGGSNVLLTTTTSADPIDSGMSSAGVVLTVDADDLAGADALVAVIDDDGTGTGVIAECAEQNNDFTWSGDLCE